MTATPASTSTSAENDFGKFGRLLRKAGGAFGIDLAGLFEDEDGQPTEGFEGFAPTFRMESQLKGRSPSTLTYKAPKTPSRTAVFELAPKPPSLIGEGAAAGGAMQQPQQQEKEKTVQQKADRLLSSFIGEDGTGGAIGAMGIGRAQEYGYTNEQILSKARAEGLKFGEQAARGLGIDTNLASYTGSLATEGALGAAAVERMRNQGLSDEAIKSIAQQQGLKFGQGAAQSLGVGAAQTYQAPAPAPAPMPQLAGGGAGDAGSYVGSQGTAGSVGAAALQRSAAAQGISVQQAAKQAQAQGYNLGAAARAYL